MKLCWINRICRKKRVRECHSPINQSINQSNRSLQVIQSTNQSMTCYWFLLMVPINQSINQSINRVPFQNEFSLWIVEISRFWSFSAPVLMMRNLMRPWDGLGDAGKGIRCRHCSCTAIDHTFFPPVNKNVFPMFSTLLNCFAIFDTCVFSLYLFTIFLIFLNFQVFFIF